MVLGIDIIVILFGLSAILGGLMAGFFFAYTFSVVPALATLSGPEYSTVMQQINDKVLNIVFGVVFFGAVVVPAGSAAYVIAVDEWTTLSGGLFIVGVIVYLLGTFAVTMRVHIPMNDEIATWSPQSPRAEWADIRTRWANWNWVRTAAAATAFGMYLAAIVVVVR